MQYAVKNIGSGEMLSDWTTSREQAHQWAAECESHESQPDCEVVQRDQQEILEAWCRQHRGQSAAVVDGNGLNWFGFYPECDSEFRLTGRLLLGDSCEDYDAVSLSPDGSCTVSDIGNVVAMMRR